MANFRTRARAVDLLGKQQIRDEVTAITELLRNSYDADASEGLIEINSFEDNIIIWDDGEGLSKNDIEEKWLTLGTYSKFEGNKITKKGRVKIGEKGIGRLAISLLGNQCLLISKNSNSGEWSILYLHWDLFRNPQIFLEEIYLPTINFDSAKLLIEFLQNNFDELKNKLISNLKYQEKWQKDQREKIIYEINSFTIDNNVIRLIRLNESRGSGTIFYIKNLENMWEWNSYSMKIKDSTKKRERRIKDALSSFQNIFNDIREDEFTFTPKIHINGVKLEDETKLNAEELKLFDYGLVGIIENGYFKGKASIRSLDSLEEYDVETKVTQDITNPNESDCGPVEIKWFFVEGRHYNSALSKEQHVLINEKLNDVGGIYVFRDGLRILPYGEAGNDFLYIEERRSLRAASYLFSHRRMYGYMGISKSANPNLIDKSSREGFIENKEYNYFQTTAVNLLIFWAKDFLEADKVGKRDNRIKALQIVRENESRAAELKKIEERNERKYLKEIDLKITRFESEIEKISSKISRLQNQSTLINENSEENNSTKNTLISEFHRIINQLKEMKVIVNNRYNHSLEHLDLINLMNSEIDMRINDVENSITDILNKKLIEINGNKYENDEVFFKEFDHLKSKHNQIINQRKNISMIIDQTLASKFSDMETAIKSSIEKNNPYFSLVDESELKIRGKIEKMSLKLYSSENILFDDFHENIRDELNGLKISMLEAEENLHKLKSKVNSTIELTVFNDFYERLISKLSKQRMDLFDDEELLIGTLKREVDMFRDLSAIGLAAELTSHEFNALYQELQSEIKYLDKALINTKIHYKVHKIRTSFHSLERLHQRMSPLYRQSRLKKQEIFLEEFIKSTLSYFKSDLERYKIQVRIDIEKNLTIFEAESILFTPIINLISNSIYWMIDSEIKEISFSYNENSQEIMVCDSGKGIREKDQEKIFLPYFSRKSEGRGLGLYLSKNILNNRGHDLINVLSETGSCFIIKLNVRK